MSKSQLLYYFFKMLLFLINSVLGVTIPDSLQTLPIRKDAISNKKTSSFLKNHSTFSYTSTMERTMDKCGDDGIRFVHEQF